MGFFGGGGASVDLASPPAIGNTTANTGRFTTVESTSRQFITTADGSVQIGRSGGNALGANAINIQGVRSADSAIASGSGAVAIGNGTASGAGSVAIGASASAHTTIASGLGSIAIGARDIGFCRAQGQYSVAIGGGKAYGGGSETLADGLESTAINCSNIPADRGCGIGTAAYASLYGQFTIGGMTARASAYANDGTMLLQWRGSTTNNTQTEIFLGGTASNRATVAANRMFAGQIIISAVMSDSSKAFFSTRLVAIKRDNANNTALVGSVQTIGSDQNTGSPTWSVDIDANDTNETLRIRVTGATSETVYWTVSGWFNEVG